MAKKPTSFTYRKDVEGSRRRVYEVHGCEGYYTYYVDNCSGCTEYGEYGGTTYEPMGCHECGFRGIRRHKVFVPFDVREWEKALDRIYYASRLDPRHKP